MKKLLSILLVILFFTCGCTKDDKIHISYSTWGSQSEISTVKSLIDDFEKENPEVKIDLIHIPDNYFQKLHLLIASNLSPDVIFINNLNAPIYINSNKFENLDDYLFNSKKISKEDFIKQSFLPVTKNGKLYVMPRDISDLVIYYNKTLFDKYRIPYPNDNWTMEDFLNTAKKFHDNDGEKIFGFGFEKNSLFWLPFLFSNGGGILSDNGNIILDNDKSVESLQFYSDLRNKYAIAPTDAQQSSLTTSQLFMQNKIAMHLCGRWCSLTYKKNPELKWDIVKFPNGKNGSIVGLDISGWAISSTSKHKQEAWSFIEFMTSNKSMTKFTKDGLIVPSRKNIAFSSVFLDGTPKNAKVFLETIETAKPTPICSKYPELNDLLNENFECLFNGKCIAKEIINGKLLEKAKKLTDKEN